MFESVIQEINANYTINHTAAFATKFWWFPIVSVVLYLLLIAVGKRWMDGKKPFSMRGPLFVWNVILAAYSIIGAVAMAPSLWNTLVQHGFERSVCYTTVHSAPLQSFFFLVCVLSKVVEFGDTFFVVTRKTPLNFLHWYHHATVCLFGWHCLAIKSAPAHWYCAMNNIVHSVMYSYYVVKSTGVRMPSQVARGVTMLQMLQFLVGLVVTGTAAYVYLVKGTFCHTNTFSLTMGIAIYFSYVILFGNFFLQRYVAPKQKKLD